jgi:predicted Zn-dependent protease
VTGASTSQSSAPQDTVERALAIAAGVAGVDGCVVIAEENSSANLRWANNTLTTNGTTRGRRLTVITTVGGAQGTSVGVVSRSAVRPHELEELVDAAVKAGRENTPAIDASALIEPDEQIGHDWDAAPRETDATVFDTFVSSLGEQLEAAEARSQLLFGYAEHQVSSTYLGSSTGLRLHHDQPTGQLQINGKSTDLARSAWAGASTRDFTDIDVAGLHDQLATRLDWAQRSVELPAGRYSTLLPPTAVADLLIYLYWSAGARDAHDGRTVFSKPGGGTRVGDQLTTVPLTLYSDPAAAGLECDPFVMARASSGESSVFDNGLPVARTAWIDDGRLASLIQTRYSASLTGMPVTPAIDNLILEGPAGGGTLDSMIAGTERGLLLTCLWYIREVDPQTMLLTGLTRDGVYLVENGEVVGAVNNFRFNESPVDMLARVTEVGATEATLPREWGDYFSRTAMPPLRVDDFNMSTVSQAS